MTMKEKVRGEVRVKRKEEVVNEDSANRHAPITHLSCTHPVPPPFLTSR